jgi:hypothetical protein
MAYSDLDTEILYNGDGVTTLFPINFSFVEDAQVVAELYDVTDPDNPVELSFDNPDDWEVSGVNVVANVAPTNDQKLMIYRKSVPVHETEYTQYEFPFQVTNVDFDRIYQIAQENRAMLERAILNPLFSSLGGGGDTLTFEQVLQSVNTTLDIVNILDNLQDQIDDNDTDIQNNSNAIQTNADNIQTNADDIQTNADAIQTNADDIQTNADAIQTNADAIQTNADDIGIIIGELGNTVKEADVVIVTGAGVVEAEANELIVVKASDVDVILPAAPVVGDTIRVKNRGSFEISVSGNGNTVDGELIFDILSNEASVKIFYDGTEWLIL